MNTVKIQNDINQLKTIVSKPFVYFGNYIRRTFLTPTLEIGLVDWYNNKRVMSRLITVLFIFMTLLPILTNVIYFLYSIFAFIVLLILTIFGFLGSFIPGYGKAYKENVEAYNTQITIMKDILDINNLKKNDTGIYESTIWFSIVTAIQVFSMFISVAIAPLGDFALSLFPMLRDINFYIPNFMTINLGGWLKFFLMIVQGLLYYFIAKYLKRRFYNKAFRKLDNIFNKPKLDHFDKRFYANEI